MFAGGNMDHVAILSKKYGLLDKIISGEKTIESRWYVNRISPWNKIKKGEIVYVKNSGEPIIAKASVNKVLQFDLKHTKVKDILSEFGKRIGFNSKDMNKWIEMYKNKNYCILMFLENPTKIKPFKINKKGFGINSAWLCINNINKIKI